MPKRRPRRRVATSRPRPLPPYGGQSRVGVRLRVRHLRERTAAEVSHRHRRIHAGMSGDRCRRRHSVRPRHRGPGAARQRPRRAAVPAVDNGPEFVARAILRWLHEAGIERRSSIRGSPGRMALTNPSTGSSATSVCRCSGSAIASTPRSASSSGGGTTTRCRPHSSLGYLTPVEFKATCAATVTAGARRRCRLALTRTNTNEDRSPNHLSLAPFSSNHWSEECRQVRPTEKIGSSGWIRTHLRQGSGGQASNPPVNRLMQVVYLVGSS